jgi:hypothetical protein
MFDLQMTALHWRTNVQVFTLSTPCPRFEVLLRHLKCARDGYQLLLPCQDSKDLVCCALSNSYGSTPPIWRVTLERHAPCRSPKPRYVLSPHHGAQFEPPASIFHYRRDHLSLPSCPPLQLPLSQRICPCTLPSTAPLRKNLPGRR